jgi:hypothetical protein
MAEELKPGDLCIIIRVVEHQAWPQDIGRPVELVAIAPTCSNGVCLVNGWSHWCPHWIVSGLPYKYKHYPSHKILRKVPPLNDEDEVTHEEELLI